MKTIIRIEHIGDEKGLWRSNGFNGGNEYHNRVWKQFTFQEALIDSHQSFPTSEEERLIEFEYDGNGAYIPSHYFCGFKSIEQTNQWIRKDWWNEIFNLGFRVLLLEVSECIEGEFQILYKKEHILLRKDISELFKIKETL